MTEQSITPISPAFSIKLQRLFRASGSTLLAGFFGLALVVASGPKDGDASTLVHGAGCVLVLACQVLILLANRKAKDAARSLQGDLPILDDLQRTALCVAEIADVTQTFAFKHLMRAQGAFTSITATVQRIPIVGASVKSRIGDLGEASSRLALATMEANDRIRLLQESLRKADLDGIREYARQVDSSLARIRKTLDARADPR